MTPLPSEPSTTPTQDARLRQAHAEVGHTTVRRPVAMTLVACCVALVSVVPVLQLVIDPSVVWPPLTDARPDEIAAALSLRSVVTGARVRNRLLLDAIDHLADRIDNEALLARYVRPMVQRVLTRTLGTGNARVYTGRDGWLFYGPDLQHVVGPGFLEADQLARRSSSGDSLRDAPQPDPRAALLEFHADLAERNIHLVVMPTPVKPSVQPDRLSRGGGPGPIRNASFDRFVKDLRAAGVLVFDPSDVLAELARTDAVYLSTDTHWRPETVARVGHELAQFLTQAGLTSPVQARQFTTRATSVSNYGDTVELLNLSRISAVRPETVIVEQVLTTDDEPWQPDRGADLLLLGDSFSNIYSLESMGWGGGAGLAEQLSLALQRPVDRLTRNDDGAFATRTALARELTRGQDRLRNKRIVVYQFATRELSQGDWRIVSLDVIPAEPAASVLTPRPGQQLRVTGLVRRRAPVPRPGTVPYRDHIVAIELADITSETISLEGRTALVYLSSMEDNVWTEAATLVVGQTVTMSLGPWADVAAERDGVTRAELVEGDVMFAEPWWGQLVP